MDLRTTPLRQEVFLSRGVLGIPGEGHEDPASVCVAGALASIGQWHGARRQAARGPAS